ncbi:MAG: hypothetical protein ACHQ50_08630 [Fimbriimonadales bacterium]
MFVSLLLLALPVQGAEIGEVSKEQFLRIINRVGYGAAPVASPYQATVTDGRTRATLELGLYAHSRGAPPYVGSAVARLEFDLPRSQGKAWIENWRKSEGLDGFQVHSFLGGRIAIQTQIMQAADSLDTLVAHSSRFFEACRTLGRMLAAVGGKPSDQIHHIGLAPLEPGFKLDFVESEDIDYLRITLKWGKQVLPGGGSGWYNGAEPLGVPVIVGGMNTWKGLNLTCMTWTDPERAKRYLAHPSPIDWAKGGVTLQSVYIQKWLKLDNGITVADLRDTILDFARHVKELDVLPQPAT